MMRSTHFYALRLIILSLLQIYFFVYIRQAIQTSHYADFLKRKIIRLTGLGLGILIILNLYFSLSNISWVDPPVAVRIIFFYVPCVLSFALSLSALLLCFLQVLSSLGKMVGRIYMGLVEKKPIIPVNQGRRRFLQAGVCGVTTVPLVLSGYGAVIGAQACEVRELSLPFGRSLRVVQLSDIHAGIYMSKRKMRDYADRVIALQPDIFVLTGDFISDSMAFLPGCLEEMGRVRPRYGTFATLGNHEHLFGNLGDIQTLFRQGRITLLQNAHQVIRSENGPLAVIGIDCLYFGYPDLEAALRGLDLTIPTILLSHLPEIFPQAATDGIRLTLAGHYHGGQIKLSLPGVDLSVAHFLTPYPEGLFRIDSSLLYVSRGIGTVLTPIRLNVPPEITLFHLT